MATEKKGIVILGIFAADLAFRAARLPDIGETLLGKGFAIGPGGKGSNQSVAAARAGGQVHFITRIGRDMFGEMALQTWTKEGIDTRHVTVMDDKPTGAAFIFVSTETGDNAIIVESGAAADLSAQDMRAAEDTIAASAVFVVQLEQSMSAMQEGLRLARKHGVKTVLNPAPAAALDEAVYPLCDFITPNETEAQSLTGIAINSVDDARAAANVFLARGVGCVLITLGSQGALLHDKARSVLVPSFTIGQVVDTTGAGDAFNGGFAVALAEGQTLEAAARFGCAVAGLSVTRAGTAPAMPSRAEIEQLLAAQG